MSAQAFSPALFGVTLFSRAKAETSALNNWRPLNAGFEQMPKLPRERGVKRDMFIEKQQRNAPALSPAAGLIMTERKSFRYSCEDREGPPMLPALRSL